jgi:ubiquinone/menaquinone biosynthesis C-methylase UbiE
MWSYAAAVLYPAQALKRAGLYAETRSGEFPQRINRSGLGPLFSRRYPRPVLLGEKTEHDHLVEEFDRMGEVYEAYVRPFSRPIFDEALEEMRRFLVPDARVMDAGCGAGLELRRVAGEVPDGEVVGIDLAAGMVNAAHHAARAHGIGNCAFVQADVGELPQVFDGQFDLVYNSLAHHHYPDPLAATRAICRCLRPGGIYCVIDPGPDWYNRLSAPIARWADPGWIGFHSPEQFAALFRSAGLARAGWIGLLPGFGLAVGQKTSGQEARQDLSVP